VEDFNPRLPSIGKILNSYKHLIYDSRNLANIFPKSSIILSFRRAKNIKEILAKPKNTNCSASPSEQGCFKCNGKCDLCKNYLVEIKFFTSCSTSRCYRIRQHITCKSRNEIYLVTCNKCKLQYVGSTSNEFKVRFWNHKSAMLTGKNTCEVAIHFNREQHVLSNFNFTIIEEICNAGNSNLEQCLTTREAHWTVQLCTLQPHGLNKRCEFNSRNRIRYN